MEPLPHYNNNVPPTGDPSEPHGWVGPPSAARGTHTSHATSRATSHATLSRVAPVSPMGQPTPAPRPPTPYRPSGPASVGSAGSLPPLVKVEPVEFEFPADDHVRWPVTPGSLPPRTPSVAEPSFGLASAPPMANAAGLQDAAAGESAQVVALRAALADATDELRSLRAEKDAATRSTDHYYVRWVRLRDMLHEQVHAHAATASSLATQVHHGYKDENGYLFMLAGGDVGPSLRKSAPPLLPPPFKRRRTAA